jgi:hypothetical protein
MLPHFIHFRRDYEADSTSAGRNNPAGNTGSADFLDCADCRADVL